MTTAAKRYADSGRFRRIVRRAAATRPLSWLNARTLHHVDRVVYRATRGRATFASSVSGLPVVMLTTTGARSGRRITSPILGLPEGDAIVVIGSNYGQARHPAWVHNLRANPRARLVVGGVDREVEAEEVTGGERERILAAAKELYPGYARYVERAAPRRIKVMRLRPLPRH